MKSTVYGYHRSQREAVHLKSLVMINNFIIDSHSSSVLTSNHCSVASNGPMNHGGGGIVPPPRSVG